MSSVSHPVSLFCFLPSQTLSVEYFHDAEGKEAIRNLLVSQGYSLYTEITDPNNLANDFVFVKKDLLRQDSLTNCCLHSTPSTLLLHALVDCSARPDCNQSFLLFFFAHSPTNASCVCLPGMWFLFSYSTSPCRRLLLFYQSIVEGLNPRDQSFMGLSVLHCYDNNHLPAFDLMKCLVYNIVVSFLRRNEYPRAVSNKRF